MPTETSQTLDRGLRVLRVLAESPEGLTVTELSSRLQVNRTVVYRLISTLEQHGLVRRDARSRLFVGLGVLHLASAVQPLLRDLARWSTPRPMNSRDRASRRTRPCCSRVLISR